VAVLTGSFQTNFAPLSAILNRFAAGATMANANMRGGVERGGEQYLAAMSRRFGEMEGGGWRPLARKTVQQRVRQGFPGPAPILRRTGELRRGLIRGAPGNAFETHGAGVRVGYGGGAAHSPYPGQKRGRASIADIAAFHQSGTSRLPARTILVLPDPSTQKAIADAVAVAVRAILNAD
jgi:hypothetical protein